MKIDRRGIHPQAGASYAINSLPNLLAKIENSPNLPHIFETPLNLTIKLDLFLPHPTLLEILSFLHYQPSLASLGTDFVVGIMNRDAVLLRLNEAK